MALELEEKGYSWLEKEPARPAPAVERRWRRRRGKDAYRASFERFAGAARGAGPRLAARAAHRRHRALRRARPARRRATRRGATRPSRRSRGRRFVPADPRPAVRGRAAPAARRDLGGLAARPRERTALARAVVRSSRGRPASRSTSLREVLRASRERSSRGSARLAGRTERLRRPQHRLRRGRRVRAIAPGAVVEEPIHLAHLAARHGAPTVSYPRTLVVARARAASAARGELRSADGERLLTNAVTEVVLEDDARVDRYKLQQEGARGAPRRDARRAARARRALPRPLALARRRALAQRHRRALRRRGRRLRARRPLRGRRPPRGRHPLADRPREAPLHEPGALQGRSSTARRAASSTASWSSARARRRPTPSR